jgi:hypothetical protein
MDPSVSGLELHDEAVAAIARNVAKTIRINQK